VITPLYYCSSSAVVFERGSLAPMSAALIHMHICVVQGRHGQDT
jgi:hypothetical protein